MPGGIGAPGRFGALIRACVVKAFFCLGLDGSGWCGSRRATHLEEELMYLNDERRVLLVDQDQEWRGWYPVPGELVGMAGPERLPAVLSGFEGVVPSDFQQSLATAFIATRNQAAYGGQQHNEEVAANGWRALDACAGEYNIRWPDGLVEASVTALGQHVPGLSPRRRSSSTPGLIVYPRSLVCGR